MPFLTVLRLLSTSHLHTVSLVHSDLYSLSYACDLLLDVVFIPFPWISLHSCHTHTQSIVCLFLQCMNSTLTHCSVVVPAFSQLMPSIILAQCIQDHIAYLFVPLQRTSSLIHWQFPFTSHDALGSCSQCG